MLNYTYKKFFRRKILEQIKVMSVFGTRPEAIKMAPVVQELENDMNIKSIVCTTAQHREMLDQVLELFKIKPDYDLNIMKENQNLWSLTSDILLKMKDVLEQAQPDIVLVHGDTTTAFAAALSAFYAKIPVGHVEAGLRTFNKYYPFPEELNRVVADAVSTLYFAPTRTSVQNLLNSGIKEEKNIFQTGNTVIDALLYTVKNHETNLDNLKLNPDLRTILLTSHRRENLGKPLEEICDAILELVKTHKDIQVIYPVHLNPNVRKTVFEKLENHERIILTEPMEYAPFATLMKKADVILTDSGGIQEEAPALAKPVLVLRDETERPEALEFGTVKLVGTDKERIVSTVSALLNSKEEYDKMATAVNPYGDGLASKRIVKAILKYFAK
ncbi:MAG: UDP-N-acetylglucosamine 2-epimerase (non-hydrolyzing) [bacterium]|nr:UDP-N-acetylglucosamine 2-epimerase (non-hydrolyzing) [bacterium]